MSQDLERLLVHLGEGERRVVETYFLAEEDVTPRQAAEQLGVSERELERRALQVFRKLQRVAREQVGATYQR